jgi:hypothetical protein
MLNESQEWLLRNMIDICEDKKVHKINLHNYCQDGFLNTYHSKSKFNSSVEARTMSDDFDAITFDQDNDYIVVSDKSGVFITESVTARSLYADDLHIKALKIIIKEYKVRGLPLPKQLRLDLDND